MFLRSTLRVSGRAALALAAVLVASYTPTAPAAATDAGDGLTATTWEAALALAQRHDKPILIDFFTRW